MCESRGGHSGLPVPDIPCGLCGRKATLNSCGVIEATDLNTRFVQQPEQYTNKTIKQQQ